MDTPNNAAGQEQLQNPGTALTPQQEYDQKQMKVSGFGFPSIAEVQNIQTLAKVFYQAGALPKSLDSVPKMVMAIEAGREAGISPIQALNSFYIVNGRVTMFGETAIEQVLRYGHTVEWGKCDDDEANVTITRGDNKKSMTGRFTMDMAKRRGLAGKGGPWISAPDNMLKFKAFHSIAKFIVPDALRGISIKEIYETEVMEAEMVEEKPAAAAAAPQAKETPATEAPANSLEEALDKKDMITDEQIKTIRAELVRVNKPEAALLEYAKRNSLDEMTQEEADQTIATLKAVKVTKTTKKKVIEDMPPKETPMAKAMREGKERAAANKKNDGTWPEEVCKLVRFVNGIDDNDLPEDIVQLKKDAVTGIFQGYEAYPNLKHQIEIMPKDAQ